MKENVGSKSRNSESFKGPTLDKNKELLDLANAICKALHLREIKSTK
jgi:hypothetical protein